jgi:hypothetical protein
VTVLDRYGHLLPGTADQVTEALDRLAATAQPAPFGEVIAMHLRDARGMES